MLRRRTIRRRARDGLELLALAVFIAFHVNHDGIAEPKRARRDSGDDELESIQRLAVATYQNSQIVASDIKNQLAFIAFVLVDSDFPDIEMLQDLIVAATNEALRQLEEFSSDSMSKITGGMGGLGGLPF